MRICPSLRHAGNIRSSGHKVIKAPTIVIISAVLKLSNELETPLATGLEADINLLVIHEIAVDGEGPGGRRVVVVAQYGVGHRNPCSPLAARLRPGGDFDRDGGGFALVKAGDHLAGGEGGVVGGAIA